MSKTTMTFWQDIERLRSLLDAGRRAEAIALFSALHRAAQAADALVAPPRRALLDEIRRIYSLERAAPPAPDGPRRILVSGIGRSGTTLIYQQLAKLLLLETPAVNFRYEPYLWNIATPGTAGNGFGPEQLHHFGLHTHLSTPLFQTGPHDVHDRFIDMLFAAPADDDPARMPDAYLAKVIRGSGRLRAYLARYPDLKIVICLRNPADTINSSLGMFSLFGEEFHEDDRPRFRDTLERQGRLTRPLPDARCAVEWYSAWWRVFTEASLAVARDFPGNVFLFCHEQFRQNRHGVLWALEDFIGLQNAGLRMGLDRPAGPSIRATSLTSHDLLALRPDAAFYRETVLERFLGEQDAGQYDARLPRKYAMGRFSFPIAGTDLGRKSPIQLRAMMLHGRSSPFLNLARQKRSPVPLAALLERHRGATAPEALRLPVPDAAALRHGKTFGVVVTCHNNAGTIADAVLSCLNQTLPFDRIVVVDDASADASRDTLQVLADHYSPLQVVHLESSLGPSAARDIGFRRLDTDFVTQLDGDDLFWPTKNAGEAAAIAGDDTAVAFSDILLVLPEDKSLIQNTSAYAQPSGAALFDRLLARTRQIPRDMTIPRQRYFEAGGYNLVSHLYEDWEFKLRLAALDGGEWRRADSVAGTVYNRIAPGLSGAEPALHARALVLIFLRALRHGATRPDALPAAFDAALGIFAEHPVARAAHDWLGAAIENNRFDAAAMSELADGRRPRALDNTALCALFEEQAETARSPLPVPEEA